MTEFNSRLGTPWRLLLLSGEAMKIKEEGPREMMKAEKAYDCIVCMNVKNSKR
jgi:hypothetical protein